MLSPEVGQSCLIGPNNSNWEDHFLRMKIVNVFLLQQTTLSQIDAVRSKIEKKWYFVVRNFISSWSSVSKRGSNGFLIVLPVVAMCVRVCTITFFVSFNQYSFITHSLEIVCSVVILTTTRVAIRAYMTTPKISKSFVRGFFDFLMIFPVKK